MKTRKNLTLPSRGFSLIELMVTIGLLAILMSLAVPSFQRLVASQRLTGATNELYTSLLQARSDAIRQGKRVTVCRSSNGDTCVAGTGTWTIGWMGYVDPTRATAAPSRETSETKTFVVQALSNSIVITGNMNYASFSSDGQPRAIDGGMYFGTIRVCNTSESLSNDTRARDLVVNAMGRVEIKKATGVTNSCPFP